MSDKNEMGDEGNYTNAQKLGDFVLIAMEDLDRDYPTGKLGDILLICEVACEDPDGNAYTTTRFLCTNRKAHVQLGLLRLAQVAVES